MYIYLPCNQNFLEAECACSTFIDTVMDPFLSSCEECKIWVDGPANIICKIQASSREE